VQPLDDGFDVVYQYSAEVKVEWVEWIAIPFCANQEITFPDNVHSAVAGDDGALPSYVPEGQYAVIDNPSSTFGDGEVVITIHYDDDPGSVCSENTQKWLVKSQGEEFVHVSRESIPVSQC